MNFRDFFNDESGETNIVSTIIIMAVVIIAALLFRSYIAEAFEWFIGLIS